MEKATKIRGVSEGDPPVSQSCVCLCVFLSSLSFFGCQREGGPIVGPPSLS
jgi:hypothetical protein